MLNLLSHLLVMSPAPLLAADADKEVGWGKLVPVVVFAIIWVIGAIASAKKKKADRQAEEQTPDYVQLPQQPPQGPPPPLPIPPVPHRTSPVRPRAAQVPPRRVRAAQLPHRPPAPPKQRTVMASAPPMRLGGAAETARTLAARETAESLVRGAARPGGPAVAPLPASHAALAPTVGARALNQWLRPPILRQQFILTEILLPPVALRDRSSHGQ